MNATMKPVRIILILALLVLLVLPGCTLLEGSCFSSPEPTPTPVPTGPLRADFQASQTQCQGACWLTFTSTSTGKVKEWHWDFNSDGHVDATGPETKTYFNENGYYTVILTVEGWDGERDTLTKTDYIYVYGCST
jgi:PKD repeat protein